MGRHSRPREQQGPKPQTGVGPESLWTSREAYNCIGMCDALTKASENNSLKDKFKQIN